MGPAREAARARGLEVAVLDGQAHEVMRHARVALVASGTATLECLYFRLPMVIFHRVGPLTWLGAKLFLTVDHIGLPNIIAGRGIVPEFLTWRDRPAEIAAAALALYDDGPERARCLADLEAARATLGGPGASRRAARAAIEIAREGKS
jgi:lipid-A-disaccharide synthase